MSNEKYEEIQGLKNDLFATKTEADFDEVVKRIGEAVNADPTITEAFKEKLRGYVNNLKEKKKAYWEKYGNRPAHTPKSSYIFREDEGKAFTNLCNALAAYLDRMSPMTTPLASPMVSPITEKTNNSDAK